MTARRFHGDRPDRWALPRQSLDPGERLRRHGPVQPMPPARPHLLARLFGRTR